MMGSTEQLQSEAQGSEMQRSRGGERASRLPLASIVADHLREGVVHRFPDFLEEAWWMLACLFPGQELGQVWGHRAWGKGCDGVMQCAIGLQRVSVHAQHMGLVCKLLITLALT